MPLHQVVPFMPRQIASIDMPNAEGKLLVEGRRKSQTVSVTGITATLASLKESVKLAV